MDRSQLIFALVVFLLFRSARLGDGVVLVR